MQKKNKRKISENQHHNPCSLSASAWCPSLGILHCIHFIYASGSDQLTFSFNLGLANRASNSLQVFVPLSCLYRWPELLHRGHVFTPNYRPAKGKLFSRWPSERTPLSGVLHRVFEELDQRGFNFTDTTWLWGLTRDTLSFYRVKSSTAK